MSKKLNYRAIAIGLCLLLLTSLIPNISTVQAADNTTFSQNTYTLLKGYKQNLEILNKSQGSTYELRVEDTTIVNVVGESTLVGAKAGMTSVVLVEDGIDRATATLTVENSELPFTLGFESLTIDWMEVASLDLSTTPSTAQDYLYIETENDMVCQVLDEKGVIMGVNAGNTNLFIKNILNDEVITIPVIVQTDLADTSVTKIVGMQKIASGLGSTGRMPVATSPYDEMNNLYVTSSNPSVCEVLNPYDGSFVSKGAGTSTLTAIHTSGATFETQVTVVGPTQIITDDNLSLETNSTKQLNVLTYPSANKSRLKFKSSDTDLFTVSSSGQIATSSKTGFGALLVYDEPTGSCKSVTLAVSAPTPYEPPTPGEGGSGPDTTINPSFKISNSLNSSGQMEIILGNSVTLSSTVINKGTHEVEESLQVVSGTDMISLTGKVVTAKKAGVARIKIYDKKGKAEPLYVYVLCKKATIDNVTGGNLTQLVDKTTQSGVSNANATKVNLNATYQINLTAEGVANTGGDLFDTYYYLQYDKKYLSYLGKGKIKAIYPGDTQILVYTTDKKKLLHKININIPYEKEYFNEAPTVFGVPKNRQIIIKLNAPVNISSINAASVFVQKDGTGNGENLKCILGADRNQLKITLNSNDIKELQRVYIYVKDIKDTSGRTISRPTMIPIEFSK